MDTNRSSDGEGDFSLRFLSIILLIAGSIAASMIYFAYAGLPLQAVVEYSSTESTPNEEIGSTPETNEEEDSSDVVEQPKQKPTKTEFTEYIDQLLEESRAKQK